MHSKIIPCSDCEKEKELIEQNGRATVLECVVLDEDKNKPKGNQRCRITWKMKAIS